MLMLSLPLSVFFFRKIKVIDWFLGLILIFVLYRGFYSYNDGEIVFPLFAGFLIFFYLSYNKELLNKVKWLLMVTTTLAAGYNIMQYFNLDFLHIFSGKMVSTFGNPNLFSQFAVVVFFLIILDNKLYYFIPAGLILFALILTGSRAAFVTLLILGGYLLLSKKKGYIKYIGIGIMLIVIGFGYSELRTLSNINLSKNFRFNLYIETLNRVHDSPLHLVFGYGTNAFEREYQRSINKSVWESSSGVRVANVHNEFLAFLFENGLIGVGIFLTIIFVLSKKNHLRKLLPLVALMCVSLFGFPLHIPSNVMLLFLLIAFYYSVPQTKEEFHIVKYLWPALFIPFIFLGTLYAREYNYRMGDFLKQHGRNKLAANYFRKAIDNPKAAYNMAFILAQAGNYKSANGYILRALKYYPYDYLILGEAGFIKFNIDSVAEAIHYYKQALEHNKYYVKAWENLYSIYRKTGNIEKAKKTVELAFVFTHNWEFVRYKGDIEYLIGDYEKALFYHKTALKRLGTAVICNNVGTDLVKLGRLQQSTYYFEKALDISPNFEIAKKNLKAVRDYLEKISK